MSIFNFTVLSATFFISYANAVEWDRNNELANRIDHSHLKSVRRNSQTKPERKSQFVFNNSDVTVTVTDITNQIKRHDISNCSIEELFYGGWALDRSCGLLTEYHQRLDEQAGHQGGNNPWSQFCWHPYNCSSQPFSRYDFCRVMEGKSIFIIGDSISYMMYQALFMQLQEPGQPQEQGPPVSSLGYIREKSFVCQNRSRLAYIRNDHLSVEKCDNSLEWYGSDFLADFNIIILNKGTHHPKKSEKDFLADTESMGKCLQRNLQKKHIVLFRTTPAGHYNCVKHNQINHSVILTQPPPLENPPKYAENFGWEKLQYLDTENIRILQKYIKFIVLDVVPMTYLRPDGHRVFNKKPRGDCLHYYLPGPPDGWVHVFYNLLLRLLPF